MLTLLGGWRYDLAADAAPNFEGTWTPQGTVAGLPLNLGGVTGGGGDMQIVQTVSTITIARRFGRRMQATGPLMATFLIRLDGAESQHVDPLPHSQGISTSFVSRARWQGETLRITTVTTFVREGVGPTRRVDTTEVLSLEEGALVVRRTISPDPGRPAVEIYRRK